MIVAPRHVTDHVDAWSALAGALGGAVRRSHDGAEVRFAGGRLELRAPVGADDVRGTHLGLRVAALDVDGLTSRLRGTRARVGRADATTVEVVADDGTRVLVTSGDATPGPGGDGPTVETIWYSPDVPAAADVLTACGLRRRLASDTGGWVDHTAPGGGLVAAHRDVPVRVELAFEHPDLDALLDRLTAADVAAVLVDEAYGRSLRLPHPDHPGREVFVNETQTDLYGFTRS